MGRPRSRRIFYTNWQEASVATRKLGITSYLDYKRRYKEDARLPSNPNTFYSDFPGRPMFLRGESKNIYSTWQEASVVAKKLGIVKCLDYNRRHKEDARLPSNPNTFYSDFPGWKIFLSK